MSDEAELLEATVRRPARGGVGLPAYQSLADGLREEITSGRLRPGDRLPTEPQLCAQSGLSRSTVREALRLLTSQHLIITTRGVNGGSFVAEPSAAKVAETLESGLGMLMANGNLEAHHLLEVRQLLEVPGAELAAANRTEAHLAGLAGAIFDPADDLDRILAAIRMFHVTLCAASGNPVLQLISLPLYALVNERDLTLQAPADYLHRVDLEHRAILDAIAAGDGPGAAEAARRHLGHLRDTFRHSEVRL